MATLNTARFNSFLEQLKEPKCRYAIQILSFAKSKVLNKWKQIDMKITDQVTKNLTALKRERGGVGKARIEAPPLLEVGALD